MAAAAPGAEDDLNTDIAFLWRMATQKDVLGRDGKPTVDLCLLGEVRYRDAAGIVRHTGFWRVYDIERRHWIADKDSGGEYED